MAVGRIAEAVEKNTWARLGLNKRRSSAHLVA